MKTSLYHLKNITIALCTMITLAIPVIAAAENTDPPQDQTLEEKFKIQEQRIKILEQRLLDLETSAMSGKTEKETAPTPAPATKAENAPATIDLSSGELREEHYVLTGAGLASKDFPGSWPMFGTDFRMKFGGYFKADALYDFGGSGDDKQFLFSQIPIDGTPEANREGYFNILVNETRFSFDIRKTTPGEPAQKFFLEMDFFDERNNAPRLRHAYVQYGNLIVGQTWSTTTELRAINYMIEWAYGDAIYGTRSKQIRWQQQIDRHWSWAVALEKLDFPGIDSQGLPGSANSRLPLLAGRVTYEDNGSLMMIGADINELRWDGQGEGPDASETAWALILSGRHNFGERDYATYGFVIGEGSTEGMGAFAGRNYNATLFPDGRLELNSFWDMTIGYTHKWSEVLSTNLNLAHFNLDSDYARNPDTMDNGYIAHANLIAKLGPHMSTGIEYIWGEVENVSGAKGDSSRVQTMVMYRY